MPSYLQWELRDVTSDHSGEGELLSSESQHVDSGTHRVSRSASQLFVWFASLGNMSSHKGLNGACSVHKYTGTFAGQPVHFKMTSVCGHVMTLDFLGKMTTLLLSLSC